MCFLVLGILLTGCGSSSLDSRRQDLASRESLHADELDALTAAGESREVVVFEPSAFEGGFQERSSALQDVPGSLPLSQAQLPTRQPVAVPAAIRQFNSIRQAR